MIKHVSKDHKKINSSLNKKSKVNIITFETFSNENSNKVICKFCDDFVHLRGMITDKLVGDYRRNLKY
jgi:hypothetical protein